MHRRTLLKGGASAFATAGILSFTNAFANQEVTLRTISSQPRQFALTDHFLKFADKVNQEGKGLVQINFVGGPEATPPAQQSVAVRQGIVDLQVGPASYYLGNVPEADALTGTSFSPVELRKNGAIDALNEVWAKRLNARILGQLAGGVGFYLFLRDKPTLDAKTGIKLAGQKMRSAPPYLTLLESLGAINVVMPIGEIYTALERGVVDGFAFPGIGVVDYGWEKFIKYRVEPPFWQGDNLVIINLDKWNSLSPDAQQFLQRSAIAWESEAEAYVSRVVAQESEFLKKNGVETFEVPSANRAAFLSNAYEKPWDRMRKAAPENAKKLKPFFLP